MLNYVAVTFGFLIPFLTIIICYSKIIRQLTADSSPSGTNLASKNRTRNRRRSVHLVSMVTATFLLCFLPYHLVRSLHLHAVCNRWNCNILLALQRGVVVTLCLAASNSMVNPLLYYYSTRTFRENMREAHSSLLSSRGGSIKASSMKRRNTSWGGCQSEAANNVPHKSFELDFIYSSGNIDDIPLKLFFPNMEWKAGGTTWLTFSLGLRVPKGTNRPKSYQEGPEGLWGVENGSWVLMDS